MKKLALFSLIAVSVPAAVLAANQNCVDCLLPSRALGGFTELASPVAMLPVLEKQVYESQNVAGLTHPGLRGFDMGKSLLDIPLKRDDFARSAAAAPGAQVVIPGAFDFSKVNPSFESEYWNLKPTPISHGLARWDGNPLVESGWGTYSQLWEPNYIPSRNLGFPELLPSRSLGGFSPFSAPMMPSFY
jgi:hypothetical protein